MSFGWLASHRLALSALVALSGVAAAGAALVLRARRRRGKGAQLARLETQVGGHRFEEGKVGLFQAGGKVYKPFGSGSRGDREVAFYRLMEEEPAMARLRPYTAHFFGVEEREFPDLGRLRLLVLEDLTAPFAHPSVADIKLGRSLYGSSKSSLKAAHSVLCNAAQAATGFRVVGMRVYRQVTGTYMFFDRHFGRKLHGEEVSFALRMFLDSGHPYLRVDILEEVLTQLRGLRQVLRESIPYRICSSSMLILYEGDCPRVQLSDVRDDSIPDPTHTPNVRLALIDIAHYERLPEGERDEELIDALGRLVDAFEAVHKFAKENGTDGAQAHAARELAGQGK
mmetsp:Transcript_31039/g.101199  ORF Transcript_31039/g.101199 Transcript_31039/m.101199 type:complete len:340 (+) Transcript_31039:2-1021(+)